MCDFLQEVKEWRKELRHLLDEFYRDLEFRNDVTLNLEVLFGDKEKLAAKVANIESDLKQLQVNPTDSLDSRRMYTPVKCERCGVLERKLSETLLELRQMKNIVCETEDKCDRLEKIVIDTRKQCAQTKQELADLNITLIMEKKLRVISNYNGHLVWCVDQYAAKLKDSKQNDVVLKSPMFSNHQYGYNLRVN